MKVITGQTGTGKTSLALQLAKENNGELISADSRQVYKGMDIGTGKVDSPTDLSLQNNVWNLKNISIYGINLISPDAVFSAGDFAEYGRKIIQDMQSRGKTPIVVGGTGFYLKSLIDPDETVSIPQNISLRAKLDTLSVEQLQLRLKETDALKLETMNNSDRNNPRRLVRAVEVAEWKVNHRHSQSDTRLSGEIEWIGLKADKEVLQERITSRVNQMIANGLENEVSHLISKYSWHTPGLATIGYKEWRPYFEKQKSIDEIKEDIIAAHLQYARKQMVYFKRLTQINWQTIS